MTSHSQVGQDTWVASLTGSRRGLTFLDIGAHRPVEISNTCMLERDLGWNGLCIDRDFTYVSEWLDSGRVLTLQDALQFARHSHLITHPIRIDYLSLDIDEDQLAFVRAFNWAKCRFGILTVEHDSYRFGDAVRDEIRAILTSHGYQRVHEFLTNNVAFEDGWVDPTLYNALPL